MANLPEVKHVTCTNNIFLYLTAMNKYTFLPVTSLIIIAIMNVYNTFIWSLNIQLEVRESNCGSENTRDWKKF